MNTQTLSLLSRCKDALEEAKTYDDSLAKWDRIRDCITNLEAAIAAERSKEQVQAQEPVAWLYEGSDTEIAHVILESDIDEGQKPHCVPLYTTPQQ